MDGLAVADLKGIVVPLNFTQPMAEKPYSYNYDPPPGVPVRNTREETHQVKILDARVVKDRLSLDRQGFVLLRHPTAAPDLYDEAEIARVYYPECERLVQEATGATRVVAFDHIVRNAALMAKGNLIKQPAGRVHNDYTAKSAPQRVRDLMGDEAEELLKGRVQVINMWRPIRGPLRDAPLAVCDSRTVAPDDLVPSDLVYRDRTGETYSVRYNPAHRWFYVPEMRRDEALLLKIADTKTDISARFMPHTAFTDPTTPPDAFPRESIELRTLAFHPA